MSHIKYILVLCLCMFFYSCEEHLEPEPLIAVNIVPFVTVTYNSIFFSWTEYDGENFERYEIYYRTILFQDNGKYPDYQLYMSINDIHTIMITVNGLMPGNPYSFFVRLIGKDGTYIDSKSVEIATLSDIPLPVFISKIDQITYNSMRVVWPKYSTRNAVQFLKYEIFIAKDSLEFDPVKNLFATNTSVNDTTELIYGLSENTTYYVRVRAFNEKNNTTFTVPKAAQTLLKPPDTVYISLPTILSENSVGLAWTSSKDPNFKKYEVHLGPNPGFIPSVTTRVKEIFSSETSIVLDNLKKNEEYFVRVLVITKTDAFSLSNLTGFVMTLDGKPAASTWLEPEITSTSIKLYWTPSPSRFFYSYDLYLDTIPNFKPDIENVVLSQKNQSMVSYTIKNPRLNVPYYLKIQVNTTIFGQSAFSPELKVVLSPR
jgi:hypothetical protein